MFVPDTPLSLLAMFGQYRPNPSDDPETALRKRLAICAIAVAIRTNQMNEQTDPVLKEIICECGTQAIDAICAGNAALGAKTPEDFQRLESEFRSRYDKLIVQVKSFFWKTDRVHLWPLAEEATW
jgi:hypothetical protein